MENLRSRKRHRSETNCSRCRLSASSLSKCAKSLTSTDDCIPTSLATLLLSEFSNFSSSLHSESCDRCPALVQLKNPFYSPCLPTGSFMATGLPCRLCSFSTPLCSSSSFQSSSSSSSFFNSTLEDKCNLRLSISSSSDDDIIASSPDSGFESTSSNGSSVTDYFESLKPEESIDDSSKCSSASFSTVPPQLCLKPTPKPEFPVEDKEIQPDISCQWKSCGLSFSSYSHLHDHICSSHVCTTEERICCLWANCHLYNKECRSVERLRAHISSHINRNKRFKCILEGCEATFSSQYGRERHVHSHFSEVNLPKARINAERKCLVKRRKIKDEKKALANIHDFMDQRSVDFIVSSLVKYKQLTTSNLPLHKSNQALCKRRCKDGRVPKLTNPVTEWSSSTNPDLLHDGVLFFASPTRRSRKFKISVDAIRLIRRRLGTFCAAVSSLLFAGDEVIHEEIGKTQIGP